MKMAGDFITQSTVEQCIKRLKRTDDKKATKLNKNYITNKKKTTTNHSKIVWYEAKNKL